MQTRYEENKGNRGIGAAMFAYNMNTSNWNSFSVTTDEFISTEMISRTIGEINEKLNIHQKKKIAD